jgi:hypothetical protein
VASLKTVSAQPRVGLQLQAEAQRAHARGMAETLRVHGAPDGDVAALHLSLRLEPLPQPGSSAASVTFI